MSSSPAVFLRYPVPRSRASWDLEEGMVPESDFHDNVVELLKLILVAWSKSSSSRYVARNMAVRWDPARPQVGVDPDVCVISPPPPGAGGDPVTSIRTWVAGNAAPLLAIEVVSESNPRKDCSIAPDKYAASGTQELVVFDPLLCGPQTHGGPFRLQVWQRDADGIFAQSYAGEGPAYSAALGAHLVVVDGGRQLRIADDMAGERLWLTGEEAERSAKEAALGREEAERAAKEAERAAKEAERAAKEAALATAEAALARVAQLEAEAELAKRR